MLRNNLYLLRRIGGIAPWRVVHSFLSQIIGFACWAFFTVVFMRYLFGADEITRTYRDIVIFLSVTAGAMLVVSAFNAWYDNIYKKKTDQVIAFALNRELFDKVSTVDVSCYENPEFYDQYTKAAAEAATRAQSVLENCAISVAALFASAYVVYTIFSINIWAGFFSFLPFLGNFFFGRITNKLTFTRDMEQIPFTRRKTYTDRVMYLQQYAKEMRLTNIFSVVNKIYREAFDGIIGTVDKHWRGIFIAESIRGILEFEMAFQGMWLFAAYLVMVKKSILIGDFVVLANAIVSTTWMLIRFSNSIVENNKNARFIDNLKNFMEYEPKINENQQGLPVTEADTLELRHVYFRYDGSGEDILRDVSFTVRSGEKVVLVGHNGAGKTTLVKLIMRLYDPTQGEIFLNGVDIRAYDLKAYRALIGAVFQDFQMFSLSVVENVVMQRIVSPEQRVRAVEALRLSGAYEKIASLPNREDTVLTREFDEKGAVLSGGEYQKIAAARAFAKDAKLLILDEPSSALDPIAEHMMYETIMQLCARKDNVDKIALIISHRLSTAIAADYVYMLERGAVIEQGTHSELMQLKGAYADMFVNQAKHYIQETTEYGW